MEQRSRAFTVLLLLAFFVSGAVALVYQVLWTRQLGLVFGVTIQAASTVLACFMGGLAIGSYTAGKLSDRLARPLRAFAVVEALIAAAAVATPFLLGVADSLFLRVASGLLDSPVLTTVTRVSLTAIVLLIPATLMGMTYPLVLRAVSRTPDGIRRTASILYAVNTTGAIVGVLFGSLWLIPALGLSQTFSIAASLNLLVAVLAWIASRRETAMTSVDETPASQPDQTLAVPLSAAARTTVLTVIALSGTVSLALEIIWFRILVFYLRPTTYAFASMLAAVLLGLAVGSYVVTPWLKRRANWLAVLGYTEVLIGLTAVLSAFSLVNAHDVMDRGFALFESVTPPYDFILPLLVAAAVAIVPTAVLLGAAFPLGLILWTTGGGATRVGQRVGTLYALNVAGAIIGSLAGGFVLIPALGAQHSLVLVASIPLVGGLILLWQAQPRGVLVTMGIAAAAFVGIAVSLPEVFQDVIKRRYENHEVLWHKEDAQATVSVVRHGDTRILLIDGMHHASDGDEMAGYHRAIGALAVALHPDPKQILIVGMGGGTTGGGASILPNAQTTLVELSPSVVEAGSWFERINRGILKNPNVTFKVADGRQFLKTTPKKFDVITADLMLPHLAGAANLYSADYFQIARKALAPGGIMVQWIPADTEFQHKLMLRSFVEAFPYVSSWVGGGILVGSNDPFVLRESDYHLKVVFPNVQAVFNEVGLGSFEALTKQYYSGRAELLRYLGDGPVLHDDRPIIEYFLTMPKGPMSDMSAFQGNVQDILR